MHPSLTPLEQSSSQNFATAHYQIVCKSAVGKEPIGFQTWNFTIT